jgi:hypothetical protein
MAGGWIGREKIFVQHYSRPGQKSRADNLIKKRRVKKLGETALR